MRRGQFSEAIESLRRGHELLSSNPNRQDAAVRTQYIRYCEQMLELNPRLEGILAGKAQPADAAERVIFAELCLTCRDHPATAVRLYAEAFASEPRLADPTHWYRFNAACAAALAAAGKGKDVPVEAGERSRLRKQALDWLRVELSARKKQAKPGSMFQMLHHWQRDPDLIGVRDEAALANLPEPERAAWRQLWADVAEDLKRTAEAPSKGGLHPKKP
jgi:hypothetical protein